MIPCPTCAAQRPTEVTLVLHLMQTHGLSLAKATEEAQRVVRTRDLRNASGPRPTIIRHWPAPTDGVATLCGEGWTAEGVHAGVVIVQDGDVTRVTCARCLARLAEAG